MKYISSLRKVGNSTGFNFTKDALAVSGFSAGQDLSIIVTKGEIRITSSPTVLVELNIAEATALLAPASTTNNAVAARAKIKAQMTKFNQLSED